MVNDWYFIGLWLGDGDKESTSITSADIEIINYLKLLCCMHDLNYSIYPTKSKAVEFNISRKDIDTREVLKFDLQNHFICKYESIKEAAFQNNLLPSNISHAASGKYKHSGGFIWKYGNYIKHNCLREDLIRLNILKNKHIPIEIFKESTENKKKFIAGIIDSDGTKNYQTISISQKDLSFIQDLEKLCTSLNYQTKIKEQFIKGKSYYKLFLKGDLRDLPILLPRKHTTKISKFYG